MSVALLTALLLAAEPLQRFEFREPHMGTLAQITLYAPDAESAGRAAKLAFARIAELNRIMSDYQSTSELMQLCAKAGQGPIAVSPDMWGVLVKSDEVSRLSDGAFDITASPVVKIWRRARRTQRLPEPDSLKAALRLVDYRSLKFDVAKKTVELTKPGMQLDLGGIAKCLASEEAVKVLRTAGVPQCLVALGGDIFVGDPPPGAEGWAIAIAPLNADEPVSKLVVKNCAVSTSGDAEQYVEIDGTRYSHIVDPRTGMAVKGQFSVTIIAKDGASADTLATACSVMGSEKSVKMLAKLNDVQMRFMRKGRQGNTETTDTPGFARLLESQLGQ